ncbi:hypothetical protein CDD81_2575 [Ophiocordyceps australis]|uniref:N-acetyltransferase domain-containing protein n=1 Tax=Ophiocordyceps australis TaxID=1399860 RepID=A0A2C5XYT1_9HYPO|nr:hypothetical protein CDD81_2575 [Ophiocordyceps australis]
MDILPLTDRLPSGYHVVSALERRDLYDATNNDGNHPIILVWPEFFGGTKIQKEYWPLLPAFADTAKFQFMVVVEQKGDTPPRVIAQANSIPIHRPVTVDGEFEPLPDGGMDEALDMGMKLQLAKQDGQDDATTAKPNTLSALSIAVDGEYRNMGLASLLIKTLKRAAMAAGYARLVVPARPTAKHFYPDVDMASYVLWTRPGVKMSSFPRTGDAARPFDPWLRKHVGEGARLAKIAPCSMVIEEDVKTWTGWLGEDIFRDMRYGIFKENGEVMLPLKDGLARLCYNAEKGVARYTEPNVWMEYDLH